MAAKPKLGVCFLCCKPVPDWLIKLAKRAEENDCQKFLNLFLNYLKADSTLASQTDFTSELVLCRECSKLSEMFRNFYFQWKTARLQMDYKVKEIDEVMIKGDEVGEDIERAGKDYEAFQKLRKLLLHHCKVKLRSCQPTVSLDRIDDTSCTGNSIPSIASSGSCGACGVSANLKETNWICCDVCSQWYHGSCVNLNNSQINILSMPCAKWNCEKCLN